MLTFWAVYASAQCVNCVSKPGFDKVCWGKYPEKAEQYIVSFSDNLNSKWF